MTFRHCLIYAAAMVATFALSYSLARGWGPAVALPVAAVAALVIGPIVGSGLIFIACLLRRARSR